MAKDKTKENKRVPCKQISIRRPVEEGEIEGEAKGEWMNTVVVPAKLVLGKKKGDKIQYRDKEWTLDGIYGYSG